MSFGSSTSPRFKVANNRNPGPGNYHKERRNTRTAPPAPGSFSRSGWLMGKMEVDAHQGLAREGFVGNQVALASPGPGAYNQRDTFGASNRPEQTAFLTGSERFRTARASGETPYRGHEQWSRSRGAQGDHGFNVSSPGQRSQWLHGEVTDSYVTRPASYQSRQRGSETPGPGQYETRSSQAPTAKMPQQQRFQQANGNPQVGPGSYHRQQAIRASQTPEATALNRSQWLHGEVGGPQCVSGSQSQHVARSRMIDTPGPGNYNQQSTFSRAMEKPLHQITLQERYARGM